jgi:hypothetical protein
MAAENEVNGAKEGCVSGSVDFVCVVRHSRVSFNPQFDA